MTDIESLHYVQENLYGLRKLAHRVGITIDGVGDEFTKAELALTKAKAVMDIIEELTVDAGTYIAEAKKEMEDKEWGKYE